MTDNIEQQDQDFFHNAANELVYRTNSNSRLNRLISELTRIPTLTTPFNSINNTNNPNNFYDMLLGANIEYETTATAISAINDSFNDMTVYKKVLSSEGEKSLKKIKYDKIKVEYDRCPILQTDFEPDEEITQLPCKHSFNTVAIERWLKDEKSECPVCRHQLEYEEKKINMDDDDTDNDITDDDITDNDIINDNITDDDTDDDTDDEHTRIVLRQNDEYVNTEIDSYYNFPVFNLINSLHRTSNLNNRNYYISTNEEDEIQEAIRLSLES